MMLEEYKAAMNALFGEGSSQALSVRMSGATEVAL